MALLEVCAPAVDALPDWAAFNVAHDPAQRGAGVLLAQRFFDGVEVLHLPQDEGAGARGLSQGVHEAAPRVGHAAGQHDDGIGPFGAPPGKGRIGAVAIALDEAPPVVRNDCVQTRGAAAGVPGEKGVAPGPVHGPQITLKG